MATIQGVTRREAMVAAAALAGGAVLLTSASGHATHAQPQADPGKQKWTCPMHGEVIKDEPGNCPICGMKLVPVKEAPKK